MGTSKTRTNRCDVSPQVVIMDCHQHYFFSALDTEEDFYKSTAPSEDIWKKFELLPTPPVSPTRTLSGAAPPLSPGDKLSRLSRVLGQDDECEGQLLPVNLSSIIIRDCMWSCFSASKQLEKVKERVAAAQTALSPVPPIAVRPSKAQCVSSLATDCVDPAAVLAIPTGSFRKPASSGSESRYDSSGKNRHAVNRPALALPLTPLNRAAVAVA